MNSRTSLLLGVMVLVVGAWLGDQFGLLSFLDGSGSQQDSELDKVAQQIAKAEEIIQQGVRADDQLSQLERRSLPYDAAEARSAYHSWLTQLVNTHEIAKSTVEVGMPAAITVKAADGKIKEAYKRFGFTLNGMGRLENITQFLFSFHRGGHIQKITSLTLTPSSGGVFSVSVIGEALSLPTCDRKSKLSAAIGQTSKFESIDDYAHIIRRNIFSREGNATLKLVKLSSITFDKSGLPEAWFNVGARQATKRLQRNGQFQVSVHQIRVIDIQPRSAMIELDGKLLDLPIGNTIHQVLAAQ